MLAGWLETLQNNVPLAWSITFYLMAGLFLALTIYHRFMLPYPDSDVKREGLTPSKLLEDFFKTFVSFFPEETYRSYVLFPAHLPTGRISISQNRLTFPSG